MAAVRAARESGPKAAMVVVFMMFPFTFWFAFRERYAGKRQFFQKIVRDLFVEILQETSPRRVSLEGRGENPAKQMACIVAGPDLITKTSMESSGRGGL